MILIVSERCNDDSAFRVGAELARRGRTLAWIDPGDIPAHLRCTLRCEGGQPSWTFRIGDKIIDLAYVGVAWWWRPRRVEIERVDDGFFAEYATAETAHVLEDLWHSLPCRWVPGAPSVVRRAEYKFLQQQVALRVGLHVPDTLVTNDPDAFFAFRERHPEPMICKPPGPTLPRMRERQAAVATTLVSHGDLARASSLRHAPVTFQPYISKRSEIRVTVVGTRVYAVEIDSQSTWRTRIDWRRYDLRHTAHRIHELPAVIASRCVELVAALDLLYGAIDLILTPEGEYMFLEINPNGQFGWLADRTGLRVIDGLSDLLVSLDDA